MSEWIKNTGVQPVADDVLVDVKFGRTVETKMFDRPAMSLEWEILGSSSDVSYWRLSPVPAKESEETTFVGLEEAYNEIPQNNPYANLPKGMAEKLACEAVEGLCDEDFPKARKTDSHLVCDILLHTLGKSYTETELSQIRQVWNMVDNLKAGAF